MTPHWQFRSPPLEPCAFWLKAGLRHALQQRLKALSRERLDRLSCVEAGQGIVILGQADDLPWMENVLWLGLDDSAPQLLMPTLLQTDIAASLLQTACLARTQGRTAIIPPDDGSAFEQGSQHNKTSSAGTLLVPLRNIQPATILLEAISRT